MTQVLAGAIGGLIALAGAFLVQILVRREQRASRARGLTAQFFSDVQAFHLEFVTHEVAVREKDEAEPEESVPNTIRDVFEAKATLDRTVSELALLSSPKTAASLRRLRDSLWDLIGSTIGDVDRKSAVDEFTLARKQATAAAEAEFGRRR